MSKTTYAQGHTAASQARHGSRNAQNTCQYFTHLLKPDMHILDVGCGPGSITSSLAALVPKGKVVGIDEVEKPLQIARDLPNLPANCIFQTGNAFKLDFEDNSFDVVHTSQLLCHLPDPIKALKEFRRVLKPGGFIACREGDLPSFMAYPMHPGITEWSRVAQKVFSSTHPTAGRYMLKWFADAGFDLSKCAFTGGTMTYAGVEGQKFGKTMAQQVSEDETYRGNILNSGVADEESLRLIKEGWEAWASDPCCVFVLICGEIVAYE